MDYKNLKDSGQIIKAEVTAHEINPEIEVLNVERKIYNPDTGEEDGTITDTYNKTDLEQRKENALNAISNIDELLKEFK